MTEAFLLLEDGGYLMLEGVGGGFLLLNTGQNNYIIALANTYCMTDAPLVVEMAYYNDKPSGYSCLTKLPASDILVVNTDDAINVRDNTVMVHTQGSYTVLVYDKNLPTPLPFSFYAFTNLFVNNHVSLLSIFNQELPEIYNAADPLNYADNYAITGVFAEVYKYIYELFYNTITSIGVGSEYNKDWELVFVGVNNFLSGAVYPSQLLKTLMQIKTLTGTRVKQIATCLSRILYQYTGESTPVSVRYNSTARRWDINIYAATYNVWVLGVSGSSELGVTTKLSNGQQQSYFWFVGEVAKRIMPAFTKFRINSTSRAIFDASYNIGDVNADDYVNPDLIYDAYEVVNNDNVFNTRGYLLNSLPPVIGWELGIAGSSELGTTTLLT